MRFFADYVERQQRFSLKTFGPGTRVKGLTAHIRKELDEIEQNPSDLKEWIDVIILAIDGAWRQGFGAHQIEQALEEKQNENRIFRQWPDWRTRGEDEPIEHIRTVVDPDLLKFKEE